MWKDNNIQRDRMVSVQHFELPTAATAAPAAEDTWINR